MRTFLQLWWIALFCLAAGLPTYAGAQTQETCTAYLATNPNPAEIPAVSGNGIAQRNAFLAGGGKLVVIGSRYYAVSIPPAFYTATTPMVIFNLHGTGGYPEAEWNDWHTAMTDRGHAFISLSWGGGTPGASTDTEIYAQLKQIFSEVGASCPIGNAEKWLMGFSVGSAMSFAVMIRDVAGQKLFRGQIAISGAAIGPLTTGKDVMHSTVESNRTNANAVRDIHAWMYCGELDFDHVWSMCTEMPNGESFVNEHGGTAKLYRDPSGQHHSLSSNVAAQNEMFDYISNALSEAQSDCLFNWAEDAYPSLLSPRRPASQAFAPYYYRYYSTANAYLGISSDDLHLYYLGYASANALLDLGVAATWADQAHCR